VISLEETNQILRKLDGIDVNYHYARNNGDEFKKTLPAVTALAYLQGHITNDSSVTGRLQGYYGGRNRRYYIDLTQKLEKEHSLSRVKIDFTLALRDQLVDEVSSILSGSW